MYRLWVDASNIPEFPAKRRKVNDWRAITAVDFDNGAILNETIPKGRGNHIPTFAPPFPKPHTYLYSEVNAVDRVVEPDKIRKEKLLQRSTVQSNLTRINEKLKVAMTSNGENVTTNKEVDLGEIPKDAFANFAIKVLF